MPFKKVGKDDYVGPSGKHFNLNQVRLYYSGGGKFPGQKTHSSGEGSYARGGPVVGTRDMLKGKVEFRDPDEVSAAADSDQTYGKKKK